MLVDSCKLCKESLNDGDLVTRLDRISTFSGISEGKSLRAPTLANFQVNVVCHTACLRLLLQPLEISYDLPKPKVVDANAFFQVGVLQADNEKREGRG